jgi:hypothetical protein
MFAGDERQPLASHGLLVNRILETPQNFPDFLLLAGQDP